MKGAISAGSPSAAHAGAEILRSGGNAVDALIAAQLSACIAEPMLTGLAGAGLAIVQEEEKVDILDCFTVCPSNRGAVKPKKVPITFGEVVQDFYIGWGSVAVPGLPRGIAELHGRYGSLPLADLAIPALQQAKSGVQITKGMASILDILMPIFVDNPMLVELLCKNGKSLKEGDIYYNPYSVDDLQSYISNPWNFLIEGRHANQLKKIEDQTTLITVDCSNYKPIWREPIVCNWNGAKIFMPPPPSSGGIMLEHAIHYANEYHLPFQTSEVIEILLQIGKLSRKELDTAVYQRSAGMTTHISVVDSDGRLAGLTSSLGESAGELLPESGLLFNNFLGETDVYPPHLRSTIQSGQRLMTMCTPTIVHSGMNKSVMGAGGSSRIRSAIFHGIHQSILNINAKKIVSGPRIHCEGKEIYIETFNSKSNKDYCKQNLDSVIEFDEMGVFFGGLNLAKVNKELCIISGASDPRRSGATIICN
ncbi:MAG: gamma-glutamyltransferase [Myxococcota bacterium]|nr:gamma-glutamyltransferase [Myxococcota bacterium]